MLSLRTAVCQSINLGSAFGRYRRYRGLWAAGVPMYAVAGSPVVPMLELAHELRSGSYHPSTPQTISIAKANGERRELRVFAIRDRVAQRALLDVLQARTDPEMSPCSYGYRPGRGVAGAVARVRTFLDGGLSWVVDADIERCFDSIPRGPLLAEVARRVGAPEAAELVAQWLGWDTAEQRDQVGIPQGSVLAPWLCNVYLWRLDDAMQEEHAAMVRFADDVVLLCAGRCRAQALEQRCAQVVERMRLRLHPLKTAIVDASRPFRFLGQWLSTTGLLTGPVAPAGGC
ncbi:reverse transcriptase domain-containing protein [uncultured Thiodictyon sp.]|uniref:reverse transcriptase domain-containing protein n=1 Tax=uncultured Thiodictyon sp. TaxID=1846217 RepID=UPI0025EBD03B|nr:reverse transcriptase domain-containing protein [uncultured Thiodictyon sp.]